MKKKWVYLICKIFGHRKRETWRHHLYMPTLDGNVHVIPVQVIKDIISGKMKINQIDEYEIIIQTVFSEWLKSITKVGVEK